MSELPAAITRRGSLVVTVVRACCGPIAPDECIPPGHRFRGPRLRHLEESERIVVTDGLRPIALAAYKRTDGELRVVHELLLDPSLDGTDAAQVTEMLLSALELVAYDEGVRCLTFLLRNSVVIAPFEQRGYMSLALDASGIWLQRKLGWLGWGGIQSGRPH